LFSGHSSSQVLEIRQDQEPNAYEQYVWGANYIDAAVVRWHDGNLDGDLNDQGDNTLYYTYDGNFNVTGLVEPDGDVVERYDYDPYGNGPGWGSYSNEILFCGYRRAAGGSLYHVRNRYYHPRLGRWMSRDPIGRKGEKGDILVSRLCLRASGADGRLQAELGSASGAPSLKPACLPGRPGVALPMPGCPRAKRASVAWRDGPRAVVRPRWIES